MTKLLKSGLGSVVCLFVLVAVITLAQGPQVVLGASGAAWVGGFADPGGGEGEGVVWCNSAGASPEDCPFDHGEDLPCGLVYMKPWPLFPDQVRKAYHETAGPACRVTPWCVTQSLYDHSSIPTCKQWQPAPPIPPQP